MLTVLFPSYLPPSGSRIASVIWPNTLPVPATAIVADLYICINIVVNEAQNQRKNSCLRSKVDNNTMKREKGDLRSRPVALAFKLHLVRMFGGLGVGASSSEVFEGDFHAESGHCKEPENISVHMFAML